MKKLLLAALLLANTFFSFAQTQIPNGDFEYWTDHQECQGMDSLVDFFNVQELIFLDAKNKYGTGLCPTIPTQYKTTDKQSGNYALKLGPQYIDDEMYYNYVTLGPAKDVGFDIGLTSYGIPFTGRPTKLTGYYKLTSGVADDELKILVFGSNIDDGELFNGQFITSVNQPTYKKFEIDLDYDPTNPSYPSILQMVIAVGNLEDGSINENTIAFIDNLVFVYDTPTSTANYTLTSPINVYAANKQINFTENVSDVHVIDMVGANRIHSASATKIVDAESLTTGLYIVTYKYNDAYFSKKIVVE